MASRSDRRLTYPAAPAWQLSPEAEARLRRFLRTGATRLQSYAAQLASPSASIAAELQALTELIKTAEHIIESAEVLEIRAWQRQHQLEQEAADV